MSISLILTVLTLYIACLFWIARLSEIGKGRIASLSRHPLIYALALGVYCTSWTFYGLVGTASEGQWNFLPILLGPILMFTLGYPLLKRISIICRREKIHSIADFIASRYGKRQGIATTVTLLALIATVPYIALQIKAVSDTFSLAIGNAQFDSFSITLAVTVTMIVFTVLVSTQQLGAANYHSGLMTAIAFESLVKLLAFAIIGFLAFQVMNARPNIESVSLSLAEFGRFTPNLRFFIETFIAACAVFCLPRMFHIAFVEQLSTKHLRTARWAFSIYLLLIIFFIFFIAWAGNSVFSDGSISGDNFVLALPLREGSTFITLIAILGGFSAATAMIIVATVTLSRMLSNDVILPLLLKNETVSRKDYTNVLLFIRRLAITFIIALGFLYAQILAENVALTSIGLIAFALAVQLTPAIFIGSYWKSANYIGVYSGLLVGTGIWFYTLILPLLADVGLINNALINNGLFSLTWLRPDNLLYLNFSDNYTRAVVISLSLNTLCFVTFSNITKPALVDRVQANAFVHFGFIPKLRTSITNIEFADLQALLNQFLGEAATERFLKENPVSVDKKVDTKLIKKCEQQLSSVVGVATARRMIKSLKGGSNLALEDLFSIFEETTRALRFNQDMLYASFENISSGISICDAELRMIAWNKPYEHLFNYPNGMLIIGRPVEELLQYNAEQGYFHNEDAQKAIEKRLFHLNSGKPYRVIRSVSDALILEIKGTPLADGGYVTTYDDITDFMHTQAALKEANTTLEARVLDRTKTIEEINKDLLGEIKQRKHIEYELTLAKSAADEANTNKSKFLAQASHDILQPLNAANLYVGALEENSSIEEKDQHTIRNLRNAIKSSENIISTLLEISRLDTGSLKPKFSTFAIDDILINLTNQFNVLTSDEVELIYIKSSLYVYSDKDYLARIVQNLLSNAIKYTLKGKIIIGCRRTTENVSICVIDSGVGIAEKDLPYIREDFYRCHTHLSSGTGLGLAVASRFCDLLDHQLTIQSELNKGSRFNIIVKRADPNTAYQAIENNQLATHFEKIKVLYVDDNYHNLNATATLLSKWNCVVKTCMQPEFAADLFDDFHPHLVLMDYQLSDEIDGIQLAKQIRESSKRPVEFCIVSAAAETDVGELAAAENFAFLPKPVKPAKLRALLNQQANKVTESSSG